MTGGSYNQLSFIRGTCKQFRFKMPYPLQQLTTIKITFWQHDDTKNEDDPLIVKYKEDCSYDYIDGYLYVTLDQRETLSFKDDRHAYVQLRALLVSGSAFSSYITPITVYPTKDETVLE